jgi:hypothetical protein
MKAPDILFGYAFQQTQTAHKEMLKRIKACIEGISWSINKNFC